MDQRELAKAITKKLLARFSIGHGYGEEFSPTSQYTLTREVEKILKALDREEERKKGGAK